MEKMGPVLQKLYDTLLGIQKGEIEAPKGWIYTCLLYTSDAADD